MISTILSLLFLLPPAQDAKKQEDQEDRIRDLERKVQELEKKQTQTTSANPLNVLNPTLTVFGNFLWHIDDKKVFNEDGDRVDDTVNLRETEFDLRAAIDPYVDGVAIFSVESPLPGDFDFSVEEFLIKIKSLPIPFWEEPPLGTQIKLGRMRTEFGTNNLLHLHDLPQSNRPLVIEEFLGEEGHIANGVSAKMFLPSPGDSALQLTLQALQGGGVEVAQENRRPAYLANLHAFLPIADEHSLDASLIGFYGTNNADGTAHSRVASFDGWYRWKPLRGGEWKSFLVGGQVFYGSHEFEIDSDDDTFLDSTERNTPFGYTAWAQYQLSRSLYAGMRWDGTDSLVDDREDRRRIQPYLSWYTSEFFRVRVSYEHTWSDIAAEDRLNTFLLEVNVVFGSHPTEPFWVNK